MTPEQQRIAIAHACGWRRQEERGDKCGIHGCVEHHYGWYKNNCRTPGVFHLDENPIPDYVYDLNAMHEAEKVLTDERFPSYREHLWLITRSKEESNEWNRGRVNCDSERFYLVATAPQRAEAFLRTIGKWVD